MRDNKRYMLERQCTCDRPGLGCGPDAWHVVDDNNEKLPLVRYAELLAAEVGVSYRVVEKVDGANAVLAACEFGTTLYATLKTWGEMKHFTLEIAGGTPEQRAEVAERVRYEPRLFSKRGSMIRLSGNRIFGISESKATKALRIAETFCHDLRLKDRMAKEAKKQADRDAGWGETTMNYVGKL